MTETTLAQRIDALGLIRARVDRLRAEFEAAQKAYELERDAYLQCVGNIHLAVDREIERQARLSEEADALRFRIDEIDRAMISAPPEEQRLLVLEKQRLTAERNSRYPTYRITERRRGAPGS